VLWDVTRLTVFIVSVVPVGIVAAFKHEAANHPQTTMAHPNNLFAFILE
jgi:hypothetical protein